MLGKASEVKIEWLMNTSEYEDWSKSNPTATILQININTPDGSITVVYKK